MDALPIALTGVCERVDSIRIDRVQDARVRRLPFQQKIGSGLTTEQFQKKVEDQSVRHVGLAESVTMIAEAFGWKLDKVTDEIQPKIADKTVESEFLAVDPRLRVRHRPGRNRLEGWQGAHHAPHGGLPGSARELRLGGDRRQAAHRAEDHRRGPWRRRDCLDYRQLHPEDHAAPPGLRTMRDMVLPSWFGGSK